MGKLYREKKKRINFYRYINGIEESALITQANGKYRVFDGKSEVLFSNQSNAIKHLLDQSYLIENLFKLYDN